MPARLKARPARYRWTGDALPLLEWETTIADIAAEVERLIARAEERRARGADPDEYFREISLIKDYMALLRGKPPAAFAAAPTRPAPPATPWKLGDTVPDIRLILGGFAFTSHWPGSQEGPAATDWYPKSTTEHCANCHRLPLALPVGGTVRFARRQLPTPISPVPLIMNTAIVATDDGFQVGFSHVDADVRTGRSEPNQVFAFVGISALEPFDAAGENPSHAHTAWNRGTVPGWQGGAGNLLARDFFAHYGFSVELRDPSLEPGPLAYWVRHACGGVLG
jgi:hypothetical protein